MSSTVPKTNGKVPLDASLLTIEVAGTLKPIKTDYMLVMTFDPLTGWSARNQTLCAVSALALDPASNCFQYCTNVFEGMKAFLDPDGKPRMFRPEQNMARLVTSAARMALPCVPAMFDPDALLVCINKLVSLEARWISALPDHALYIRPTMIGTKPSIKVGASDHATLYVIVTPVGPYFQSSSGGVSLLAGGEHVRSWPGGTGGFKLGPNYSPGFVPQRIASDFGYDQVLWLLGEEKQITEAGAMNFFAVIEREEGGVNVVTPPLDGTILPGITRDSALVLLRAHAADPAKQLLALSGSKPVYIEERVLTVPELAAAAASGTLLECFGTGTAVLVVAIERIGDVADPALKTIADIGTSAGRGLGPVGQTLWDKLLAVKEGREDFHGWSVLCE
ncbi:branched-chain amino acid aminotransferase II [Mycena maculata]|uniref:Branched-chain-amino-acid aminotransferase n=1 Tax=Mycena maculata TaxID=230809 RepID=A0AAD7I5H9_9AGAR|nr:branched-chain amino acid aminotransferase II [Mycena maculata]